MEKIEYTTKEGFSIQTEQADKEAMTAAQGRRISAYAEAAKKAADRAADKEE